MENSSQLKIPLIAQFRLHHLLYNNVLEGFSDDEANQRLNGDKNVNHIKYLAGHLLNSQYGYGFLAGLRLPVKWHELFAAMNQSKARDDISYPSIDEIKSEWNSIHSPILEALNKLSEEELNRVPPKPLDKVFENNPFFENTIAGFMTFLNHHQAYHIGQAGIMRKAFGKEPLRYW